MMRLVFGMPRVILRKLNCVKHGYNNLLIRLGVIVQPNYSVKTG